MVFESNKDKGNSGLGMAIAYFTSNGYTVSVPMNDTQDYDLVIEQGKKLQTVQVKATNCKTKYGVYQVPLKSFGGTKGKTYKTLVESYADILFILTGDRKMYCIPCEEIKNKSTINISGKVLKYEVQILNIKGDRFLVSFDVKNLSLSTLDDIKYNTIIEYEMRKDTCTSNDKPLLC